MATTTTPTRAKDPIEASPSPGWSPNPVQAEYLALEPLGAWAEQVDADDVVPVLRDGRYIAAG